MQYNEKTNKAIEYFLILEALAGVNGNRTHPVFSTFDTIISVMEMSDDDVIECVHRIASDAWRELYSATADAPEFVTIMGIEADSAERHFNILVGALEVLDSLEDIQNIRFVIGVTLGYIGALEHIACNAEPTGFAGIIGAIVFGVDM